MLLDKKDIGRQFELYISVGKFELPSELDEGQQVVFNHIAQAVPQSLFSALENNIKFLFQQEVELAKLGDSDSDDASRVAQLRESLVSEFADSDELGTWMGRSGKFVVANYLISDLRGLAGSTVSNS